MSEPVAPGESESSWFSSPRQRVDLLSIAVLVPLVLIAPSWAGAASFVETGPWVFVLITLGFVVGEPLVFHIEARNEAVSFSPTDLPLAIGLLMLSPLSLLSRPGSSGRLSC